MVKKVLVEGEEDLNVNYTTIVYDSLPYLCTWTLFYATTYTCVMRCSSYANYCKHHILYQPYFLFFQIHHCHIQWFIHSIQHYLNSVHFLLMYHNNNFQLSLSGTFTQVHHIMPLMISLTSQVHKFTMVLIKLRWEMVSIFSFYI